MALPPPPPPHAIDDSLRERWMADLRALDTPDLLALCLEVHGSTQRLRSYLSVLRSRTGTRAQLACCLVCFDLARHGDALAEREFEALAPTMIELASDSALSAGLVKGDLYLERTWEDCAEALRRADTRHDATALASDEVVVGELDLLSDLDIDLPLEPVPPAPGATPQALERAHARYGRLLAAELGEDPDSGGYSGDGFATSTSRDLDRLQTFLQSAAEHADLIPAAAGMRCLGQLFLATHLRSRTIFGRPNAKRRTALLQGLKGFPLEGAGPAQAAAGFDLAGAHARLGFEKVLELVLDYLAFCARSGKLPGSEEAALAYVEADREVPPILLAQGGSRRRRS